MNDAKQSKLVDEIVLHWERNDSTGSESQRDKTIEDFCLNFEGADQPVIAEVKRRVFALEFMDHFLSGEENTDDTELSCLSGQVVCIEKSLTIEQQVARGGRAVILKAHDQSLDRHVAIKTLIDQTYSTLSSQERLANEARTIGRLDHPGILPVIDTGHLPNKAPFYSMPLVDGQSLKDAIDNLHKLEPGDSRSRETNRLLRAFISICQTVAYAHSHDIVHRDIKPGNIMLGRFGEAFLVDWGLCKNVNQSESKTDEDQSHFNVSTTATRTGTSLGTPAFMSPEQAAGSAGFDENKSDLFNLGATLYSILTGHVPYDAASIVDVMALAKHRELKTPRTIDSGISKSLEAICLKAMAAEPADRYDSPGDLIEDLERSLQDQPVSAKRETVVSHALRFARHNSTAMLVASAALIALVLVVGFFAYNLDQQRRRADRNAELAWNTVNATINDVKQNQLLQYAGFRPLRTQLLSGSLTEYNNLLSGQNTQELSQQQLAEADLVRGQLNLELHQYKKATSLIARGLDYLQSTDAWFNEHNINALASAWSDLHKAALASGNTEIADSVEGRFASAHSRFSTVTEYKLAYADTLLRKCKWLNKHGKVDECKSTLEEFDSRFADLNKDQNNATLRARLALVRGELLQLQNKPVAAIEESEQCLALTDASLNQDKNDLNVSLVKLSALKKLSEVYAAQTDTDQTESILAQQTVFLRQLIDRFPSIGDFREQFVLASFEWLELLKKQQRWTEAIRVLDNVDAFVGPSQTARHLNETIDALMNAGMWHRNNGRSSEASIHFARARKLAESNQQLVESNATLLLAKSLLLIGFDQWTAGNDAEALQTFSSCQNVLEQHDEYRSDQMICEMYGACIMGQALSHALLNQPEDAISKCRNAIDQLKHADSLRDTGNDPELGNFGLETCHFLLACALEQIGDSDYKTAQQASSQYRPSTIDGILALARAYALESQLYGRGQREFKPSDRFMIQRYHEKIVMLLTAAKEMGFEDFSSIESDPAYFGVFRNPEFRSLLN